VRDADQFVSFSDEAVVPGLASRFGADRSARDPGSLRATTDNRNTDRDGQQLTGLGPSTSTAPA
jgi:hypothetical protein